MPLFETAYDLTNDAEALARRPHGVIEVVNGRLNSIRLKPWPSMVSQLRVWKDSIKRRAKSDQDICHIFYDQLSRFLVLKYIVTQPGTSFRTLRMSTLVLDEIARLKKSNAIVCEVRNEKISDRLLDRWGWESHVPSSSKRHFIKRFYGTYPVSSLTPACEIVLPAPVPPVPELVTADPIA